MDNEPNWQALVLAYLTNDDSDGETLNDYGSSPKETQ